MGEEIKSWMKPKKDSSIVDKIDREALLFDMTTGRLYELNETGRFLWSLCDGKHTISQIIEMMREEYDASTEKIAKDTILFLKKLSELYLINFNKK